MDQMKATVTITAGWIAVALAAGAAHAQVVPEPRFEVASVKRGDPADVRNVRDMSPGQYRVDNVSLLDIVAVAFDIPPERIDGAPDWVARERFSVTARMPAGAPIADRPKMVQALLLDRFKLRARVEPREQRGYELMLVRSDRRAGPQLVPSTIDCVTPAASGDRPGDTCKWNARPGVFTATGVPSALLALYLSGQLGTPVVDRTQLQGTYDMSLMWARESIGAPRAADSAPTVSDSPFVFVALQEQLGLKLVPASVPAPHVIVEHLELPEAD
jgi:uncharacterized protein (TIGR03435 family)